MSEIAMDKPASCRLLVALPTCNGVTARVVVALWPDQINRVLAGNKVWEDVLWPELKMGYLKTAWMRMGCTLQTSDMRFNNTKEGQQLLAQSLPGEDDVSDMGLQEACTRLLEGVKKAHEEEAAASSSQQASAGDGDNAVFNEEFWDQPLAVLAPARHLTNAVLVNSITNEPVRGHEDGIGDYISPWTSEYDEPSVQFLDLKDTLRPRRLLPLPSQVQDVCRTKPLLIVDVDHTMVMCHNQPGQLEGETKTEAPGTEDSPRCHVISRAWACGYLESYIMQVRPGVRHFLQEAAKVCMLVMWTAADATHAHTVRKFLDPTKTMFSVVLHSMSLEDVESLFQESQHE